MASVGADDVRDVINVSAEDIPVARAMKIFKKLSYEYD